MTGTKTYTITHFEYYFPDLETKKTEDRIFYSDYYFNKYKARVKAFEKALKLTYPKANFTLIRLRPWFDPYKIEKIGYDTVKFKL